MAAFPARNERDCRAAPPLRLTDFPSLIDIFGPFEDKPHLAVAVSGGADSLCLCLMADAWARARGGRVTALTVDHGLRGGSAAEARQVGEWLAGRGIAHRVLPWVGEKPASGVQAAARTARYELLEAWCRREGVLHLLLAHHADDQAETYLMRRAHASGPDGLAAMAAVSERGAVRVLRPLLGVGKDRLQTALTALGQAWIDDPSNANAAFERVRIRQARAVNADEAGDTLALVARTAQLGRRRADGEAAVSLRLAAACVLDPAGFARLDLSAGDGAVAAMAARVFAAVGGSTYPVAPGKARRVLDQPSGTLAGCAWRRKGDAVLVWRENRGLPAPVAALPGGEVIWDNRFRFRFAPGLPDGVTLAPLGQKGVLAVASLIEDAQKQRVFRAAQVSLPALWRDEEVFAVPAMAYKRDGAGVWGSSAFRPPVPLGGLGFVPALNFTVAPEENRAISKRRIFGFPAP